MLPITRLTVVAGSLALAASLAGCGGRPGRLATPDVDPDEAAEAAMQLYDRNADGQITADELKASPPLTDALPAYDGDHDGALSQAEISAGIDSWSKRGIGAMPLPITVRLDGAPLEGAEVKLVPAPFLGDAIKSARGVADRTGSVSPSLSDDDKPAGAAKNLPIIQPGLYSVEITHPTRSIPARFNSATTLGLEAGVAGQNPMGVTWELESK
jgi:hypothetical protein